jgi:hypothetical protein
MKKSDLAPEIIQTIRKKEKPPFWGGLSFRYQIG